MAEKLVRFYTPVLIDEHEQRHPVATGFWKDVRQTVGGLSATGRRVRHNGAVYFGQEGVGKAPTVPFVRVGRLRFPGEWPEVLDPADQVQQLQVPGNLLESAYLVPFGAVERVAIMGPIRGLVSTSAITSWLVAALDLPAKGYSLEFVPELDPKLVQKVAAANGVSTLKARIPAGSSIDWPDGTKSAVDEAFDEAVDASDDELDVVLEFSFGRRKPTPKSRQLLQTARRLWRSGAPTRLEAGLMLEEDGGFRVEHHNLLDDKVARVARFPTSDAQQLTQDEILTGISAAIREFQSL